MFDTLKQYLSLTMPDIGIILDLLVEVYLMFAWYVWAILTVAIWGFHYNFINKATEIVSPLFVFVLPFVPLFILLPFYYQILVTDVQNLMAATNLQKFFVLITAVTGTVGTLCLFQAIATSNNPTMAALVEITYPLLVAIVGYFLFHEHQLNPSMLLGGTLILFGSALIIFTNK
jgi:drug/metabolite transporter (DMT)-like permease